MNTGIIFAIIILGALAAALGAALLFQRRESERLRGEKSAAEAARAAAEAEVRTQAEQRARTEAELDRKSVV